MCFPVIFICWMITVWVILMKTLLRRFKEKAVDQILNQIKIHFQKNVKFANMNFYVMGDADDIGIQMKKRTQGKTIFARPINCFLINI